MPLDAKAIRSFTQAMQENKGRIAQSKALTRAALSLIQTYEARFQPLPIPHSQVPKQKRDAVKEIQKSVCWLMKHMLDHVYTPANLDRFADKEEATKVRKKIENLIKRQLPKGDAKG